MSGGVRVFMTVALDATTSDRLVKPLELSFAPSVLLTLLASLDSAV